MSKGALCVIKSNVKKRVKLSCSDTEPVQQAAFLTQVAMYLDDGSPSPILPVVGQHFMPLKTGDVVDVVVQNMHDNANGEDALGLVTCILQPIPFWHGMLFCLEDRLATPDSACRATCCNYHIVDSY